MNITNIINASRERDLQTETDLARTLIATNANKITRKLSNTTERISVKKSCRGT